MIVMIDNYDSFTYNLVQYIGQFGTDVVVFRNDETTSEAIEDLAPQAIFISPGPGTPADVPQTCNIIRHFYQTVPLLGICLGHQSIGHVFGADIVRADRIMHGKTSRVFNDGETIFTGLPNPFEAGRYHSLIMHRDTLPPDLIISAETEEGEIMGVRHRDYPVEGIQFHPESILTPRGKKVIKNFLLLHNIVTGN